MATNNYRAGGGGRQVLQADSVGDGNYEVTLNIHQLGTYYLFVGVPSRDVDYSDLPFFSLIATPGN